MRETISNQSAANNQPPSSTVVEPAADDAIDAAPHVVATDAPTVTISLKSSTPLPPATVATVASAAGGASNMKRPLTLDLNAKPTLSGGAKRQRFNTSVAPVSVLNSPDLQMLNLASPELEKFMTASNLQTPTPSLVYPQRVSAQNSSLYTTAS